MSVGSRVSQSWRTPTAMQQVGHTPHLQRCGEQRVCEAAEQLPHALRRCDAAQQRQAAAMAGRWCCCCRAGRLLPHADCVQRLPRHHATGARDAAWEGAGEGEVGGGASA